MLLTFKQPLARLVLAGLAISLLSGCYPKKYLTYSEKDNCYYEYILKSNSQSHGRAAAYGIGAAGAFGLSSLCCLYSNALYIAAIGSSILAFAPVALPLSFYAFCTASWGFFGLGSFFVYRSNKNVVGEYEKVRKVPQQEFIKEN